MREIGDGRRDANHEALAPVHRGVIRYAFGEESIDLQWTSLLLSCVGDGKLSQCSQVRETRYDSRLERSRYPQCQILYPHTTAKQLAESMSDLCNMCRGGEFYVKVLHVAAVGSGDIDEERAQCLRAVEFDIL